MASGLLALPFLFFAVVCLTFASAEEAIRETLASTEGDQVILLQSSTLTHLQTANISKKHIDVAVATPLHISASAEMWPYSLLHSQAVIRGAGSSHHWYNHMLVNYPSPVQSGVAILVLTMALLGLRFLFPGSNIFSALGLASLYIGCSAMMIESNKWLMSPGRFPYPLTLTSNHMLMSFVLANCLRACRPTAFPSLAKIEVTPWFLLKFVPIGAAFALSLVCGNSAYKFLSVSFLQCMKQWNVVIIYTFSVLCGLEALRRCSIVILALTLSGTLFAIHGELHFHVIGFVLQVVSSLSEATKVIVQGVLMSGTLKLDPMTMVLFMAPACLLANIAPLAVGELSQWSEIATALKLHLPFILVNACLAFALNVIVAQCIKQLSPVGYLLCGIVKDVCIIVTSSFFLGESLQSSQLAGFSIALCGVAMYSLYKQNIDCFEDDSLLDGFVRVGTRLTTKADLAQKASEAPMKKGDHK